MKYFLIVPLFFLTISGYAQERTIALSTQQFDKKQIIQLADLDGWVYQSGNNQNWSAPDFDDSSWKQMRLTEISTAMADESGRVEGWFRLKIQLDESFQNIPLGIVRQLWAATDVYIDGTLVHAFGNTGGNPYQAYNPVDKFSRPVELEPGKVHQLAIHFVDYETLLTQRELRLKPHNLEKFISIAGPEFNKIVTGKIKETYILGSVTIAISFLLFVLFLLLLILNPLQKVFQLATILTFVVLLASAGSYSGYFYELSYTWEKAIFLFTNGFSLPVMHAFTLLITEWVLKKRVSIISKTILLTMPVASALGHVFSISWPFGLTEVTLMGYFIWLVISSWKRIKAIEWTVVLAMFVLTLGSLIWVFMHKFYFDSFYEYENFIKAIVLLSAPILFLLYVSFSYKEILDERAQEAKNVIRITNEKRELLEQQNTFLEEQVAKRTLELEKSLVDLKAAQAQLIQSEKLASLGELTAGIAHEIQNPLNFVNNFSELSVELAKELDEEVDKETMDKGLVKELVMDLTQNQEKINLHGKRASSIVKGMLEHSRTSTGEKELTDINKLADEYLRLSYHGIRAKDNAFNADFEMIAEENLPEINVIPQDIGRVLLNLINNAFWAVKSAENPKVVIKTAYNDNMIIIKISDNGSGIPDAIKDKIFQPFFTTKPTGQGTGLGLSLSYDIIKAHGGTLNLETTEGEGLPAGQAGSMFTIQIPIS